jgi:hypothetical protein
MYNMIMYYYVLIVFSLHQELLKLILTTTPSEVILSHKLYPPLSPPHQQERMLSPGEVEFAVGTSVCRSWSAKLFSFYLREEIELEDGGAGGQRPQGEDAN